MYKEKPDSECGSDWIRASLSQSYENLNIFESHSQWKSLMSVVSVTVEYGDISAKRGIIPWRRKECECVFLLVLQCHDFTRTC